MADKAKKISELSALSSGLANNDVFVVVDTSASQTKKITVDTLYTYIEAQPTNLQLSSLTALSNTTVNLNDQLVIFDDSASDTKKITVNELRKFLDDQATHLPTQRVTSGSAVANASCKVILCDTTSGSIGISLPNTYTDGKAFYIKNTGNGTVTVSSTGGCNVENSTGNLVSFVEMNGIGMSGYWILDSEQNCYRLFGGRIS